MNILITGGNGHLGRVLLKKISNRNYNIFVLDKEKSIKQVKNIKYIQADISQKRELYKYKNLFKKIDVLMHLAAYVPKEQKLDDIYKSIDINLRGSINLINLLKEKSKFIYANTLEIYTVFSKHIIDENLSNEPPSYYAISKLFAERYLEIICKKKNIKFVSLRFGSIYGPGEKIQRAIPNFIKSGIRNDDIIIFGNGQEKRQFLYIEDAARSIIKAIKYRKSNIFNISSEENINILNLAKLIIKISKSKSRIIFKPRVKEKRDLVFSIRKAERELKFHPIFKLNQGLEKEIEYFKKCLDLI
ncbi:NAD(P)-dependent oxidoreductase [Candidatus Parcubacteria bacterium]|nr:NAD(P)-dependent oxidoreductase [Candidatus Parcubacteria bacterium]